MATNEVARTNLDAAAGRRALVQLRDDALNDSDKALVVPAGHSWEVVLVRAEWTSDATAGTRKPEVQIRDAANVLLWSHALADLAASTSRVDQIVPGDPIPTLLLAGHRLRVVDAAGISPAGDDLVVDAVVRSTQEVGKPA